MQRAAIICAFGLAALAGTARADEFPDGATKPSAGEIRTYVEGKVFNVKAANGDVWRLDYKADGNFVITTGAGRTVYSQWTHEDGRLCDQTRGKPKSCNDVRMVGDVLQLKRENGSIILLTP